MDVFLYSGNLNRGSDLNFIRFVSEHKKHDTMMLVLCTPGGAPDAAYKMGRYLQKRYDSVKVFIPGFCKSAGTLLAICADELVFSPYGELGPLDIQMAKADSIAGLESGLNISEAFLTLENRAKETFHQTVIEIISNSGGVISFQTASHSATEIVSALYGPIFSAIDPEEVGSRARAMRIGEDYGQRLNQKYNNLKQDALSILSQSYPSHGFVIDMDEASRLFLNVREANDIEKKLVTDIGRCARIPNEHLKFDNLTEQFKTLSNEGPQDGQKNTKGTDGKPSRPRAKPKPRRRPNGKTSTTSG